MSANSTVNKASDRWALDGNRLWQHRRLTGDRQRQVAERIGVRGAAVSRWERGVRRPSNAVFARLPAAYRVDLRAFVSYLRNPPTTEAEWAELAADLKVEVAELR